MADEIDALLNRIDDDALRSELIARVDKLRDRREFGLVFEQHLPEVVVLPNHEIRRGTKVLLADDPSDKAMTVTAAKGKEVTVNGPSGERKLAKDEVVAVAEFGEPIYPGLKRLDSTRRAEGKAAHVVIKAENYHALEALQFTHAGKVDCIYIDPPYNTGNRDWKYNNDYVDRNDSFRHSKWLSFIERRLRLARKLLTPDGTLVVTIDEHEVENLGLLLRQTYPEARVQLVTIVMNTAGQTSVGQFSRADEYAYFCRFGNASAVAMPSDMLSGSKKPPQIWFPFHRSRGENDKPSKRKNLVYPIGIDPETLKVVGTGPSIQQRVQNGEIEDSAEVIDAWLPSAEETVDGYPAVWPLLAPDELSVWQMNAKGLAALLENGFFRIRDGSDPDAVRRFVFAYVKSGNQKKTLDGTFATVGEEPCGARKIEPIPQSKTAKTVWKIPEHDARIYGTPMLELLVKKSGFKYPKSPYAVRDTLQSIVGDNKDAIILDFFAGSGTTAQSTFMLNEADGGRRQCILITNNEVDGGTQDALMEAGLRPGDPEFEARGLYDSVTHPRVVAALTGKNADGEPLEEEYVSGKPLSEGFDENVEFLELEYLDPTAVELDQSFDAIAPLLWMRAGSHGEMLRECRDAKGFRKTYAYTDNYGVLFDPSAFRSLLNELPDSARHVFVVTDSSAEFASIASKLPHGVEVAQLYENYLTTFAINTGGMS